MVVTGSPIHFFQLQHRWNLREFESRVSESKESLVKERFPAMTKADLVEKVTALGDLTRRDSEVIVETIFESVIQALHTGDKIEIRGFGSFRIRQRKPRIGRNPKTGERVDVPAKKVPYFKPSKELRDLVNPGEKGE
jgi:integration host factor subunit beta